MAPHLARAQSACKDIMIHSFHHTHTRTHTSHTTNTRIPGYGSENKKKEKDRSVYRREEVGF